VSLGERFESPADADVKVFNYIEVFYINTRPQARKVLNNGTSQFMDLLKASDGRQYIPPTTADRIMLISSQIFKVIRTSTR
jgi:hypothetical protein